MNKPQLQRNLGLVVIFGHTIIVLEIFFFFFRGGLLFEEMTTSLALISPMLAVYTSAIIKHFNQEAVATIPEGETLSTPYVLVTYLFPLLYLALIFAFV